MSKPIIPPKPKFIKDKSNLLVNKLLVKQNNENEGSLTTTTNDVEYNLSQASHYSELNENISSTDAYSLLDEIYAEIEDKNIIQRKKVVPSSSSSSSSSYSSSIDLQKPPPLPSQPPPRLTTQQINEELLLNDLDESSVLKLCDLAFNDSSPNDNLNLDSEQLQDEQNSQFFEDNYLEPIQINLLNSNSNTSKRKSIAIESTNQLKNIIRSTNTKLTNTLKLIRTKSLNTNSPDKTLSICTATCTTQNETTLNNNNNNNKSLKLSLRHSINTNNSIMNIKSIDISEPTLISQTFDITKQNFIEINMKQNDDSSTSSSSSIISASSFSSYESPQNNQYVLSDKKLYENGKENNTFCMIFPSFTVTTTTATVDYIHSLYLSSTYYIIFKFYTIKTTIH
jgi:hypothetical protein